MKKYYVLHKWDPTGRSLSDNKHQRELYDKLRGFDNKETAVKFAMSVLVEKPILFEYAVIIDNLPDEAKNPKKPYVLASHFNSKYSHYCYDGSSDSVPTYEVEHSSQKELSRKLEKLAEECPDKLYWGLELKLI